MSALAPLLCLLAWPAQAPGEALAAPELDGRPELVGRDLRVEGRRPRFDFSRLRGWDEFQLLKSRVRFRLAAKLVPPSRPAYPAVSVRGALRREGATLVFDVTEMEVLPGDLERLETATATLAPRDAKGREAWIAWAERHAKLYNDAALAERAHVLAGEAVRARAAMPTVDTPEAQLKLANEARQRNAAEPEPSALAHKGFRGLLAGVDTPAKADTLVSQIEAFFPRAANPAPAVNVTDWEAAYRADPAEGYRQADAAARPTLDRRLLADAIERSLQLRQQADPAQGLALAEEARRRLPDRPEVAARLQRLGLDAAEETVGTLRLAEVQTLAGLYRDELNQPQKAGLLLRRWLDDQRKNRLSRNDAEGRLALAEQYEQLVGDRAAALALIREAWGIDPDSSAIADAFRRRGYRKMGEDWVATSSARDPEGEAETSRPAGADPYIGLTREEVRSQLGKPAQVTRVATQGQLIEQWSYPQARGHPLRINFLSRPDQPRATVISRDSVP